MYPCDSFGDLKRVNQFTSVKSGYRFYLFICLFIHLLRIRPRIEFLDDLRDSAAKSEFTIYSWESAVEVQ